MKFKRLTICICILLISIMPLIGFTVNSGTSQLSKNLPGKSELILINKFCTFLGGNDGDYGYDIAVDDAGCSYITGWTNSTDLHTPSAYDTTFGGYFDAYAMKYNADGSRNYSTYIGGTEFEIGNGIAIDDMGACYVVGETYSDDFPTINAYDSTYNGGVDIFLTKINPDGYYVYNTYFGTSQWESASAIAVDNTGACYIAGDTGSSLFPILNAYDSSYNGNTDGFLAKFNSDGSLNYSTFIGGTGSDRCTDIDIGADGRCYIIGDTSSVNFPTLNPLNSSNNGHYDTFITIMNPDGSLNFSTYLGGSDWEFNGAISVHDDGDYYISTQTSSSDIPLLNAYNYTKNGGYDLLIAKLNNYNEIEFSTYFGGGQEDALYDMKVGASKVIYIVGSTTSIDFPVQSAPNSTYHGGEWDAFITSFDPSGNLISSLYFGGSGYDFGRGIGLDMAENCYITGYTNSTDLPITNADDPIFSGNEDGFLANDFLATSDTDEDGIPDYWEEIMGLNTSDAGDALLDFEPDGLNNLEEFIHGSDPNNDDTDGDYIQDGAEVNSFGTDPANSDTDSDLLTDYTEIFTYSTNPLNPDTDSDDLNDYNEIYVYSTDPNDSDTDGDGYSDGWEVQNGLDPLVPNASSPQPPPPNSKNWIYISIGIFVFLGIAMFVVIMVRSKPSRNFPRFQFGKREKFCPECGINNDVDSELCRYCGKSLDLSKLRKNFDQFSSDGVKNLPNFNYCGSCGGIIEYGKCTKCRKEFSNE